MNLRTFLSVATAGGVATGVSGVLRGSNDPATNQIVELRLYTFASEEKKIAFDEFLSEAMIPALNRAGVDPVGVFCTVNGTLSEVRLRSEAPHLYLSLPHNSADSFVSLTDRLAADDYYQEAGRAVLDAPRTSPAYTGCETSALISFNAIPRVAVPTKAASRVMQLRIYQAHNDTRAYRKMQMFSEGGEIAIFRRCGMHPIFGGRALAGGHLPNVTYMLGFDDEASLNRGWDAFGRSPDWQRLTADKIYSDTDPAVITNRVLRPTVSSQI